jgi:hypothetical protein
MGEIPLIGANIRPADYKNKKFCFQIETPNRIYHIIASSEADMKDWMACLKEVVVTLSNLTLQISSPKPAATPAGGSTASVSQPPSVPKPSDIEGKVGLEDFDLLKVIGKGSFGKVLRS